LGEAILPKKELLFYPEDGEQKRGPFRIAVEKREVTFCKRGLSICEEKRKKRYGCGALKEVCLEKELIGTRREAWNEPLHIKSAFPIVREEMTAGPNVKGKGSLVIYQNL